MWCVCRYAGNANGVLSIQNVPGSHRWATPCDWDGIAFCVKPIPIDVTDSRMFMGWWMVPTRIPDTVNSNNIRRACSDNGMQTVCDHGAWNNGQCVTLGSFHMSYNPHHPQFIPSYLTNKNFYAGSAYNGDVSRAPFALIIAQACDVGGRLRNPEHGRLPSMGNGLRNRTNNVRARVTCCRIALLCVRCPCLTSMPQLHHQRQPHQVQNRRPAPVCLLFQLVLERLQQRPEARQGELQRCVVRAEQRREPVDDGGPG
jgi:hypothetical protein